MPGVRPRYFRSADEWRAWLEEHHEPETEPLLGFYEKTGT
jgi:hypothetical protein